MLRFFSYFVLAFLVLFFSPFATVFGENENGTLIVTYQMDEGSDRLDRIRFWLINEQGERQLHPKKCAFVDDAENSTRTVVIEDLTAGPYRLVFLIPNKDHAFEPVAPREFHISPQNVVRVDQQIKRNNGAVDSFQADSVGFQQNGALAQKTVIINYPNTYPYGYYEPDAYLTVKSNLDAARWTLYSGGFQEATGSGKSSYIRVRPGTNYHINAEPIQGYTTTVRPPDSFTLLSGDYFVVDIYYEKSIGFIEIKNTLTGNLPLTGQIHSLAGGPSIPFELGQDGRSLIWRSPELAEGVYRIAYDTPEGFLPRKPENIRVVGKKIVTLSPKFIPLGSIKVTTNTNDARYILKKETTDQKWAGKGMQYAFSGLEDGNYVVQFSAKEGSFYEAPRDKRVYLGQSQTMEVKGNYKTLGKLIVLGNSNLFTVSVRELGGQHRSFEQSITNGQGGMMLPPGNYRVSFQSSDTAQTSPAPIDVKVKSLAIEKVNALFESTQPSKEPEQPSVLPPPQEEPENPMPEPKVSTPSLLKVPATEKVDSFMIGTYEVTNEEYGLWLNRAFREGTIFYTTEGQLKGTVVDQSGKIVCKTYESGVPSQITAYGRNTKIVNFFPLPGFERYPVVAITWHGARLYCEQNGYRLPTEKEWEVAAGQSVDDHSTFFVYGFSRNEIDPTWANYRTEESQDDDLRIRTKVVGFYNGENLLPLSLRQTTQEKTHRAESPVGAFDMSGNVREWVVSSFEDGNIAKGGSYNSLPEALKVKNREKLPADHLDHFTGFRIAQ